MTWGRTYSLLHPIHHFSWVPQVCRSRLEAGRFASQLHPHPLAAKGVKSVGHSTNPTNAKTHQPSTVCCTSSSYVESLWTSFLSPVLISSYLFKRLFRLSASFIVEWGLTAMPGSILLQQTGRRPKHKTRQLMFSFNTSALLSLALENKDVIWLVCLFK